VNENIDLPDEKISILEGTSFSVGAFSNNILNGLVFANLTFFYIEKLGADPISIGIAWLIFMIWNTINDPIFSYIMDNTRTKIGRRIPYIRYGSVFYGLAFIFSWFPIAAVGDEMGLFFNFLLVLFLLDTIFTFVGCCFFCLPNEMAVTAKGRSTISVYLSIATFVSVILIFALPILLLTDQEGIPPIFHPLMVLLGISCALGLFISSFGIKENMFAQLQPHEPFIEGLRLTLKNQAFWIYMIPAFCIALILPVLSTGILYYLDYVIIGQDIELLLIGLGSGVLIGVFLNLYLIDKIKPKKTTILNFSLATIGFIFLFLLGRDASLAALPGVPLGFGFVGLLLVGPVVMGDIIDNDEYITGKRREAVYGGVNAIVTKPAISIANWLFVSVIVMFGFISPIKIAEGVLEKQPQPPEALAGILFAMCVVPAICLGISAIIMHLYPLDGPEWLKKKKLIIEGQERKEQEYLRKLSLEAKQFLNKKKKKD